MTVTSPSELNGVLHVWLVPIRGGKRGLAAKSITPTGERKRADHPAVTSPFLPARADFQAKEDRTWTTDDKVASFWGWPPAVLLAARVVTSDDPFMITFGRSVKTLAEESDSDQPLVEPASSSYSLWQVPGMGVVLALEKLVRLSAPPGETVAEVSDELGAHLREPTDQRSGASELLEYFTGDRQCTLGTLFGDAVSDLADLDTRVAQRLIPRRTAIMGQRQVEGLLVSVASSTQGLGVESLLLQKHPDKEDTFEESDAEQEAGYGWRYTPVSLTQEPANPSAVCALRSDGHVAVLDLDAFSIYHDYLDQSYGGHTVAALIPLAGLLGQRAQDFCLVTEGLRFFGAAGVERGVDGPDPRRKHSDKQELCLEEGRLTKLRGLRDDTQEVWVRMELRRLLQEQLFNESSFVTWSVEEALRRQMARLALADVVSSDDITPGTDDPLDKSLMVLDAVLQRQLREAELEQQRDEQKQTNRTRAVLQGSAGVVAGAGLLGLFAALAAVPQKGAVISSLVSAGLWTLLSATVLGSLTASGLALLKQAGPTQRVPSYAGIAACALVAVAACVGGLVAGAPLDAVLLVVAGVFFLGGIGVLLWSLSPPEDAAA